MGGQARRGPATTGGGAEAGLETWFDVAERHMAAQSGVSRGTAVAHRMDVTGRATQYRLDDRPGSRRQRIAGVVDTTVVEYAHYFMTGNEGKADHVLEVARATTVKGRQITPADPGQQWAQMEPVVSGKLRRLGVEETHRTGAGATAGTEDRSDP